MSPSYDNALKWCIFFLILLNILAVLGRKATIRHEFGIEKAFGDGLSQSGDAPAPALKDDLLKAGVPTEQVRGLSFQEEIVEAEDVSGPEGESKNPLEDGTDTGQRVWDPLFQEEIVEAEDVSGPEGVTKNPLEDGTDTGQRVWNPSFQEEIVEAKDVAGPVDDPRK